MAKSRKGTAVSHTAETIGAALGRITHTLDAWKKQQEQLVKEVEALSQSAKAFFGRVKKDQPAAKSGQRKGPVLTPAARKALERSAKRASAARAVSAVDDRSRIRAADGKHWTARQQGRG